MFTGIVQGMCALTRVDDEVSLRRLELELGALAEGLVTGASVAVNGTCLTVTSIEGGRARFDVIRETLGLTNLGTLEAGDRANVERSFRVGDEVGGHILSGHITGLARVSRIDQAENERTLHFSVAPEVMKYLSHKGFVALDGASLTIATVAPARNEFTVSLIPETIARTTLGTAAVGAAINLEVDSQTQSIVDTVERVLNAPEWQARLRG